MPVWYAYSPGGAVRMIISSASRKAELLRAAGRASLCVQADVPPYKYVSVEGAAALGEPDFERDERAMAHRYLGAQWESDSLRCEGNVAFLTEGEHHLSVIDPATGARAQTWIRVKAL